MIIDGRAIASDILEGVRKETASFARPLRVRAVVVSPSPATESYLRVKAARAADAGMQLDIVTLPDDVRTEDVIAAVTTPGSDATIVQLPLPAGLDQDAILEAIPAAADADVLSPAAYDAFTEGKHGALVPPVAGAVAEILARANVDPRGKRTLVIGSGRLVGQPVFEWLRQHGAEAVVVTKESQDALPALMPAMDLVVSGAGSPGLITPDLLKEGVVLIDAGTSESNGQIAGDADPAAASVASVFTPVPGGVGPIAVACLFRNVASLARQAALTNPSA